MRWFILFVALMTNQFAHAQELKLSKYPKVFKGGEGVTVTVIPVVPESSNQALVKITGIDDDLDEKVFLHTIQNQGKDKAMVIMVDGSERTRLRTQTSYWWKQFNLYLPNQAKPTAIYYDEKESKQVDSKTMLQQYNRSDKSLQAKLAKFDRKAAEQRSTDEIKTMDESASKECGTSLKTTVAWKSINNPTLQKYSIPSYCGRVVDNLDYLCRNDAKVKPSVKKAIDKVSCQFGTKTKLTRSGKSVNWTIDPESPNQDDFVRAFLKNEL